MACNFSDGTAFISTGDANALGNASNTEISQSVDSRGSCGPFGGISVLSPSIDVVNRGNALAVTGGNRAVGNDSDNTASVFQDIFFENVRRQTTLSNSGFASNVSDGTAFIGTGDATAFGNRSVTSIDQAVAAGCTAPAQTAGPAYGDSSGWASWAPCCASGCCTSFPRFGGINVVASDISVVNRGDSAAVSGGNVAVGNDSENDATVDQEIDAQGPSP